MKDGGGGWMKGAVVVVTDRHTVTQHSKSTAQTGDAASKPASKQDAFAGKLCVLFTARRYRRRASRVVWWLSAAWARAGGRAIGGGPLFGMQLWEMCGQQRQGCAAGHATPGAGFT